MGEIEGEEGAGGRRAVGVDVLQKRRAGGELAAWYQRGWQEGWATCAHQRGREPQSRSWWTSVGVRLRTRATT